MRKPQVLFSYYFSSSKLFFFASTFLQSFPTNFVLICWIPFNGQHCTEVFSSQQSLEGGKSKLRDRKSQSVHLPC